MDRISISKFVNEYLSLDPPDRKSYLDSIMAKKYVPCLDKNTIISAMLEGAIDTQYDIPRINYFAVHIDFNMALLIMYTKLSIDKNGEDDKEAIFRAYDLLKEIVKKGESGLNMQILVDQYLKGMNILEAYSFIEDLKNEGYIIVLPITGLIGPQTNIRTFYDGVKNYDYMQNINQPNIVKVTTKGYDYYLAKKSEKWRFWIPLIVSIIALITSMMSVFFK